jgi:ABC-type amino acid transport system permease subunit
VWFACLAALIAFHTAFVDHFIPFRKVFTDKPLQGIDYDLHIGQVYRVVEALSRWGKTWLYDVDLLAGQPEGTITDAGSKGWELWTFVLVELGVPRGIAFNSWVMLIMLAAPFWLALAARTFRLNAWACLLAAAMTSTLWLFDSHLHWIWFVGMISWSGASCLAMWTLALFYRFSDERAPRWAVLCSVSLSVGLLIHPYTFFVLGPPLAVMYLRAFRRFQLRDHALVGLIGLLPLVVNAFWLHNAYKHWHYILDSAFYAQAQPHYLLCDLFEVLCNGADSGVIGTRTGFRFLYLLLAIAGLIALYRQRDNRFIPYLSCLLPLYVVAYFGGFIPGMQQTQPYRQITPAMLLTTLPAAAFVAELVRTRVLAAQPWMLRTLVVVGCAALAQQLIATQVLYYLPELVPYPKQHPDGARSPMSGYGFVSHPDLPMHIRYGVPHDRRTLERGSEELIGWLEDRAAPGDRVLVENAVLGERMAWRTKLEVLGGFFERNVRHVDANYFREHRDHPATPERLVEYFKLYAVQWVVTGRREFSGMPHILKPLTVIHDQRVYRMVMPVNRVLQGGGTVVADENLIQVRGSDPKLALVLSYHWHEALRCKPGCRVERQELDIDRVGFIRVPPPHPVDFTIWNSYESW